MKQTRAFIDIYTKDYPVGKVLKCNLWLKGIYSEEMVSELLHNHLNLDQKFKEKYIVAGFKVNFAMDYQNKNENIKYGEIIIMDERDYDYDKTVIESTKGSLAFKPSNNIKFKSNLKIVNDVNLTRINGKTITSIEEESDTDDIDDKTKKKKKYIVDIKRLQLHLYTEKELINLKHKIEIEFFKRKYKLSDNEFLYYLENRKIIRPENIKKSFKRNGGDAFKIRKNRIRKKLFLYEDADVDSNDKTLENATISSKVETSTKDKKSNPIKSELSKEAIKVATKTKIPIKKKITKTKPKNTKRNYYN